MRIKLTENVRVHDTLHLAKGREWEVRGFQIFTNAGDKVHVLPSECEMLGREVTEADVEIARLESVVATYEELIRKWAADVQKLRQEVGDED